MKVAVLGAPGAGKTDFARALSSELGESPLDYLVLDDYTRELRKVTGQEYGMLGNHIDDLAVVFKRLEWERAWGKDRNTITVGTILDSAAHNFTRVESVHNDEVVLTQVRLQAIAATFGMLYTDTWDYDYAFLLSGSHDDRYSRLVAQTLGILVSTYRAPVLTFNSEVPDDEKAGLAAETIRTLEEEPATPPDERGVRGGGEDREADGDSPEPVPDVPEQGTDES